MTTKVLGRAVLVPKGNWSNTTTYTELDLVHYAVVNGGDGCSYAAIKPNRGVAPNSDSNLWMKITERSTGGDGDVYVGSVVETDVPIVVPAPVK